MRFELIDRIIDRQPERLTALKSVTTAEEYLADHFPEFPVLPGVMMLETLVQAARAWALHDQPASHHQPLVVREVRNVKYGQMVRPGQTLHVEVTLRARDDNGYEFQGVGRVDNDVAVQGRFRLAPASDAPRTTP